MELQRPKSQKVERSNAPTHTLSNRVPERKFSAKLFVGDFGPRWNFFSLIEKNRVSRTGNIFAVHNETLPPYPPRIYLLNRRGVHVASNSRKRSPRVDFLRKRGLHEDNDLRERVPRVDFLKPTIPQRGMTVGTMRECVIGRAKFSNPPRCIKICHKGQQRHHIFSTEA